MSKDQVEAVVLKPFDDRERVQKIVRQAIIDELPPDLAKLAADLPLSGVRHLALAGLLRQSSCMMTCLETMELRQRNT